LFERKRGSHEAGCVTRVKQSWRVRSLICNEKTPIVLSEKTAMRLRSQGPLYVRGEAGHPGGGQENNNWEKMKGRGGGEAKRSCWSPPPKKSIWWIFIVLVWKSAHYEDEFSFNLSNARVKLSILTPFVMKQFTNLLPTAKRTDLTR
jgi:hypothetical protein